jgi:hypothetical protein
MEGKEHRLGAGPFPDGIPNSAIQIRYWCRDLSFEGLFVQFPFFSSLALNPSNLALRQAPFPPSNTCDLIGEPS